MLNFALNENHDIYADKGTIAIVTDIDEIVQHIKTRLQLFLGEWFLDIEAGVPWFQEIFVKPAKLNEIEVIIKNEILQTEGVNELLEFDLSFDSATRIFNIQFTCNTDLGDSENVEVVIDV